MKNDIFSNRFQKYLCISCGACEGYSQGQVKMVYDKKRGMFFPQLSSRIFDENLSKKIHDICPGYGYKILPDADEMQSSNQSLELGQYNNIWASQSNDKELLSNASSGGVMSQIAIHLLDTNQVDGVIVTGINFANEMPLPNGYIARNREEVLQAQGSKYCPSPTLNVIQEILSEGGTYAVIGTPCQIAALKTARKHNDQLDESIHITIANFCGGFRDLRETERLIRKSGFSLSEVSQLTYRGSGQPGFMTISDRKGITKMLPYPDYAKMTGIMKCYRCRTCIDATGELADISCGDAWIDEYLQRDYGWSIVISRNNRADNIMHDMEKGSLICLEPLSEEKVIKSQLTNITSKKYRQHARRKLYKLLGIPVPYYDGGYSNIHKGMALEIKVHISTAIFHLAELMGVYDVLMKFLKRKA